MEEIGADELALATKEWAPSKGGQHWSMRPCAASCIVFHGNTMHPGHFPVVYTIPDPAAGNSFFFPRGKLSPEVRCFRAAAAEVAKDVFGLTIPLRDWFYVPCIPGRVHYFAAYFEGPVPIDATEHLITRLPFKHWELLRQDAQQPAAYGFDRARQVLDVLAGDRAVVPVVMPKP